MQKRIGNIEIDGQPGWVSVVYHCNKEVSERITLRDLDDIYDLQYALQQLIRVHEASK